MIFHMLRLYLNVQSEARQGTHASWKCEINWEPSLTSQLEFSSWFKAGFGSCLQLGPNSKFGPIPAEKQIKNTAGFRLIPNWNFPDGLKLVAPIISNWILDGFQMDWSWFCLLFPTEPQLYIQTGSNWDENFDQIQIKIKSSRCVSTDS